MQPPVLLVTGGCHVAPSRKLGADGILNGDDADFETCRWSLRARASMERHRGWL